MTNYQCFDVRKSGGTLIVDIKQNELSEFELQERLHDELREVVGSESGKRVLVNLANVELIGSHAIGILVDTRKTVHGNGGQLALCGLNANVRLSFQVLNLDGTLFKIFDSETEALRTLE